MSRVVAIGLALVWMTLLNGCNFIQPLEVQGVDGLEDVSIGRDGLEGRFTILFNNPNSFSIQAKGVEVDVFVNEQLVGRVSLPTAQTIAKGSGGELSLEFETEKGALIQIIEANLMNFILGEEVKLSIEGDVQGSAFGIGLSVPVEAEQNVKIQL